MEIMLEEEDFLTQFMAKEISSQRLYASSFLFSFFSEGKHVHEESLQIFELPAEGAEVLQCNYGRVKMPLSWPHPNL